MQAIDDVPESKYCISLPPRNGKLLINAIFSSYTVASWRSIDYVFVLFFVKVTLLCVYISFLLFCFSNASFFNVFVNFSFLSLPAIRPSCYVLACCVHCTCSCSHRQTDCVGCLVHHHKSNFSYFHLPPILTHVRRSIPICRSSMTHTHLIRSAPSSILSPFP